MSSSNKSLTQIYDRACARPMPKSSGGKPSIKPSILGSPCLRKVYYSYNKAPEDIPFPLENARITNLGTVIGEMLADAFYAEGVGIKFRKPDGSFYVDDRTGKPDYEFRLTCPELEIKLAKIDLVFTLDDGLWLGEFKSINERGFKELKGPKPDHNIQGTTYLYLFNLALKEGKFAHIPELANYTEAKGIRYVYYWKDKSQLKEFAVTKADETFKSIVFKIEEVKSHTANQTLPPKTPDWCQSCTYQRRCAANKKAHE